jgi:hypothetical protein
MTHASPWSHADLVAELERVTAERDALHKLVSRLNQGLYIGDPDAWTSALDQISAWQQRAEKAEAERDALCERLAVVARYAGDYEKLAAGIGYAEYAWGRGYPLTADPDTIIAAWRSNERERDELREKLGRATRALAELVEACTLNDRPVAPLAVNWAFARVALASLRESLVATCIPERPLQLTPEEAATGERIIEEICAEPAQAEPKTRTLQPCSWCDGAGRLALRDGLPTNDPRTAYLCPWCQKHHMGVPQDDTARELMALTHRLRAGTGTTVGEVG